MPSKGQYSPEVAERIFRGHLTCKQAAEETGLCDKTMYRWKERFVKGLDSLRLAKEVIGKHAFCEDIKPVQGSLVAEALKTLAELEATAQAAGAPPQGLAITIKREDEG